MKKRILIGYFTPSKSSGINNYLYNVLDALKDEEIEIDALTSEYSVELEEYLKIYNVRLFTINRLIHPIKRYYETKRIVSKNKYDIVYLNISEAYNCVCNIAAFRFSNAKIITHSHSSKNDCKSLIKRNIEYIIHKLCISIIKKNTDYYYACSTLAGRWLFGNKHDYKLRIIRNTVDTQKFEFCQSVRNEIRSKNNILEDDILFGFAGNFVYQKNILFLADIFYEIYKKNKNVYLIMLGDGELKEELVDKLKKLNIINRVILTGRVRNVNQYMSAMDAFILPSLFEGLPIVGIEAQVNGLNCFFSDAITKETEVSNLATFINHNLSANEWANEIQRFMPIKRKKKIVFHDILVDKIEQKQEFKDIFLNDKF